MTDLIQVSVLDGKYTVILDPHRGTRVLRYGEEVRILGGSNLVAALVAALAREVHDLREWLAVFDSEAKEEAAKKQKSTSEDCIWLEDFVARLTLQDKFTASDVARLRRLADWAECPPPPTWNGTLDQKEALRAVAEAKKRIAE